MIPKGIISNKSFSCTRRLSFCTVWKVITLAEEIEAVMFSWLMGQATSSFWEGSRSPSGHRTTSEGLEPLMQRS